MRLCSCELLQHDKLSVVGGGLGYKAEGDLTRRTVNVEARWNAWRLFWPVVGGNQCENEYSRIKYMASNERFMQSLSIV